MIKGRKNIKWITREEQGKQDIEDKISKLYKDQYIDNEIYEAKHSNSQNFYIELPLYSLITDEKKSVIDFNNPEYIKVAKG